MLDAFDRIIDKNTIEYFVFAAETDIVHEDFHLLGLLAHDLRDCEHCFVLENLGHYLRKKDNSEDYNNYKVAHFNVPLLAVIF